MTHQQAAERAVRNTLWAVLTCGLVFGGGAGCLLADSLSGLEPSATKACLTRFLEDQDWPSSDGRTGWEPAPLPPLRPVEPEMP